jgi:hypothetical protein
VDAVAVAQERAPGELAGVLDDHVRRAHVEANHALDSPGQLTVQLAHVAHARRFFDQSHIESN